MGRKGLLLLIYFGAFLGPFAGNSVLPLIPTLQNAFNVGIGIVAFTITASMVPFAFFSGLFRWYIRSAQPLDSCTKLPIVHEKSRYGVQFTRW